MKSRSDKRPPYFKQLWRAVLGKPPEVQVREVVVEADRPPVVWSPAAELFDAATGRVPRKPGRRVDPDAAQRLADSWARVEQEEAWEDMLSRLTEQVESLHRDWLDKDSPEGAAVYKASARILRYLGRLPDFSRRRLAELWRKEQLVTGLGRLKGQRDG